MDEQLNGFYELILQAIYGVSEEYFRTAYYNVRFQKDVQRMAYRRLLLLVDDVIYKPGERIFAYEFYFQLRKLLDTKRQETGNFLESCLLQAEVKKHQLPSIMEQMPNLTRLSRNYIPDFLLHSPGDDGFHAFVIELKASLALDEEMIFRDLSKLSEFITRYHYQRGVFISIFKSLVDIENFLSQQNVLVHLRASISEEAAIKIKVVTREYWDSEIEEKSLSEIIYANV